MIIRPETPHDIDAIRAVTEQAFGRPQEATIIEALRSQDKVILSLVAVHEDAVVGHLLFFSLIIQAAPEPHSVVGLGPLAVAPQQQRQGIGTALVRHGLEALRQRQAAGVIVLGHPQYYPRFGFVPASTYGIKIHYAVPDEVFMALELHPGGLAGKAGTVLYPAAFDVDR